MDLRRWLLLALVAFGGIPLRAQEPSLEVELYPPRFGIEDAARLTVRLVEPSGTPQIELGPLENLELVSGPSTKTEFSLINGVATRAVSYSYMLQAVEVGAAAAGPVVVTIGDRKLQSEVVSAEVVPGSVVSQRPPGRRSPFGFDPFEDLMPRRQPTRAARVALRQLISDREVVLGEPVKVTIVLDTTASAPDAFEWIEAPSYPRWWAQRVEPPKRVTGDIVEVDGERYNRFVVARHVLLPLRTGQLVVPSVRARIGFRTVSIFGPPQVLERATEEIGVEVSPRPPAPEGFSGAVGKLSYAATIEPSTIDFGESAVVTVTLEGNGNLPLVEAPAAWPASSDCETYPPEEESSTKVDASGIHGRRQWRMTVVPRSSGTIELEPSVVAVFDPTTGEYRRQKLGPLSLEVIAPEPTPGPTPPPVPAVADGREATEAQAAEPKANEAEPRPWSWIIGALFVGLLAGAAPWFLSRRRRSPLPPKQPGEKPAERARQLQVVLERWWLDARTRPKGQALETEMGELRT
ncbi:MAG: BatD family protein, partial [Holophagae bacterium]